MSKVRTIAEVIADLQGYDQTEKIAVQWWIEADFEEYEDKNQALSLTQDYLDYLNPNLIDYVDNEYKGESK